MGDSSEKMKITGLNIDCLESVFEYLEFGDLLSVASSNKRLNRAANFVYVREYAGKEVLFRRIHLSRDRSFEISNYFITIQDLKISLQFLRCFGHLVYEIKFESSAQTSCELEQHVINYINEYCSGTLKSINIVNFSHTRPIEWGHLKKPFSKIDQVISIDYGINSSVLCGETIAPILRLTPKLVNLQIYSHQPLFDSNDFQNAIKSLHNLETLSLNVKTLSTNSMGSVICLNNVKTLKIYFANYNNIVKIPFLFGQLDALTLIFKDQLLAEFFNFIDNHPKVEELTLTVGSLSVMDQSKIAKSLPSLVTICFWRCKISAKEAINFMSTFKNLRKFVFKLNDITAYDDFQARLSTEWDCKINKYGMISVNRVAPGPKKCKLH